MIKRRDVSNICSTFVAFYAAHKRLADIVRRGDFVLFSGIYSYCKYLLYRKFDICVGVPSRATILRSHVSKIICLCSQKKVSWVDASSNVAFMADVKSVVEKTMRQSVGEPMCSLSLAVCFNHAVSALVHRTEPKRTSLVVWWRSVMRESLRESPVTLATALFKFFANHNGISSAVFGQSWDWRFSAAQLAHSSLFPSSFARGAV